MDLKNFIDRIFHLIGNDKLDEAIKEMGALLSNSDLLNDLTLQKARYKAINKQIRNGLVNLEDANLELNRVRYALIDIVRDIEESSEHDEKINAEVKNIPEDFAQTSINVTGDKNIVIGNITSDRDSNISINQ